MLLGPTFPSVREGWAPPYPRKRVDGVPFHPLYSGSMTGDPVTLTGEIDIAKANEPERQVFGWAMVSATANGDTVVDHQGDIVAPEVLEKAAYRFALDYRQTGDMHRGEATGTMIESIVFTPEKIEKLGLPQGSIPQGWWVGFQLEDDEQFALVKNGDRAMFSIQGTGVRTEVEA